MTPVLMSSFCIRGNSGSDTYRLVQTALHQGIEQFLQRYNAKSPSSWETEWNWQAEDGQTTLTYAPWTEDSGHGLAGLPLCDLAQVFDQQRWEVSVRIGIQAGHDDVILSATWHRPTTTFGGKYPLSGIPRLLDTLNLEGARPLDLDLPYRVTRIGIDDIPWFCREVLENPRRFTPVIAISPTEDGSYLVDSAALARQLFGLAVVCEFQDAEAAHDCTAILGKSMGCDNGAVRIYRPGFSVADPPRSHEYRVKAELSRLRPGDVIREAFRLVAQSSVRQHELPGQLRALEQRKRQIEQQQRADQLARLRQSSSERDELWDIASQSDRENAKLREDNEKLREERQGLLGQIDDLARQLQVAKDELARQLQVAEDNWRAVHSWSNNECNGELGVGVAEEGARTGLYLSQQAHKTLLSASPQLYEEFCQELRKLQDKPELRKSQSKRVEVEKSDCLICPQGDSIGIRIFYYEHPDGSIRVCEVADHRDRSYERLLSTGKVQKHFYDEAHFQPFQEIVKRHVGTLL